MGFVPTTGGVPYYANAEASGLIQLVPLLAALYDNEIGALLIDEPEISLHPQLQTFLLQEIEACAGDPVDPTKKVIVIATHSTAMLPVRRITDIPKLVFFTERNIHPIQIDRETDELKSAKLSALILRLTEGHKIAFFARNVLLVEGPSDEIIINALSTKLNHPLLGSNTQIVPVTGKGQIRETVKLFRLMGKKVFVMADLDALADDNSLVNVFRDEAQDEATTRGMGSIIEIDRSIRSSFSTLLDQMFEELGNQITKHSYWLTRNPDIGEELKAKRRATLAILLTISETEIAATKIAKEILAIRRRYDALFTILAKAGCVILRRGTIENYYISSASTAGLGKPEAAALEMEKALSLSNEAIRSCYDDVVLAMETSAPIKKIDENALLREQLGSLLGAALQIATPGMLDAELNARASAYFGSTKTIFRLSNLTDSRDGKDKERRVKVDIDSPLFIRDTFPFEVTEKDNLTLVVAQKLPSAQQA